ncbi:MAG: hypothetical protein V7K41_04880 [Nostoc sp.]|uniref:hypothetical protein n=1 Tax=Nostoc sp. TaxID=1180 RepID=UPI002FF967FE
MAVFDLYFLKSCEKSGLNILNLMLAYLNELNCDRKETEPDNPTSKEMPKL